MFMVSRTNCLRGQSTAGLKVSENLTSGSVLQRNPDIQYGETMGREKAKETGRPSALLQRSAVTPPVSGGWGAPPPGG